MSTNGKVAVSITRNFSTSTSMSQWCFTLNNPEGQLNVTFETEPGVRYAAWQLEIGEEGTSHYQGYLELERSQRLSWLQSLIPGAHFEKRRGTREQARAYAMKEESRVEGPYEHGTWTGGQGARNDINAFKEAIDRGDTDLALWDSFPNLFLRYGRMLQNVRMLKQPRRSWKTQTILYYGPPKCGKSRAVAEISPDAYWKPANTQWFDGYDGKADIVLDDYKAWLPWSTLLTLLDRYPMQAPVKGGHVNIGAQRIFITSNFLPCDWYSKDDDNNNLRKYPLDALTRRFDVIRAFRRNKETDELEFKEFQEGEDKYSDFVMWVVNFTNPTH